MRSDEGSSCKLCRDTVWEEDSITIDTLTKDVLSVLLLNLEIEDGNEHVMCNACNDKLFGALEFKYMCLETDSNLIPHVNFEDILPVDLQEVYLCGHNQTETVLLPDQKVCRLCMHLVDRDFVSFDDVDIDSVHVYIPEVNFLISKDPILCKSCSESVTAFSRFIKQCLNVLTETNNRNSDSRGNSDISEESDCESSQNIEDGDDDTRERLENKNTDGLKCSLCNFVSSNMAQILAHLHLHDITVNIDWYKCSACDYRTKSIKSFWKHMNFRHMWGAKFHKCRVCGYKTKYEAQLEAHRCIIRKRLNRKKADGVWLYRKKKVRCKFCGYKTHTKRGMDAHHAKYEGGSCVKLKRKVTSTSAENAKVYQCEECDYNTKKRHLFQSHMNQHTDPGAPTKGRTDDHRNKTETLKGTTSKPVETIKLYECDECDYNTEKGDLFQCHMNRHLDSRAPTYNCALCDYKTPLKRALTHHYGVYHKEAPEMV